MRLTLVVAVCGVAGSWLAPPALLVPAPLRPSRCAPPRAKESSLERLQREAREKKQYKSELYNEQISLLCNIEGARLLGKDDDAGVVQPIFRSQQAPRPDQLKTLRTIVSKLVEVHKLPTDVWLWKPSEALVVEASRNLR